MIKRRPCTPSLAVYPGGVVMNNRIYIIGPAHESVDYKTTSESLNTAGWEPIHAAHETELASQIAALATCNAVCLLEDWWSDRDSMCLQTIAAWLRLKVLDPHGRRVPTASLRG